MIRPNNFYLAALVAALPKGTSAWILPSPISKSTITQDMTSNKHDYVYIDPTASYASDLYQLEQLEKGIIDEKERTSHPQDVYLDPNAAWASDASLLDQLDHNENEEHLRQLRHRHYEARKHMKEGDLKKDYVYFDPKASWASDISQLEQLEESKAVDRKIKQKKDYVYLDPKTSWASDVSQLEQLEEKEKQEHLGQLRHRHHEARKHMPGI